VIKSAILTRSHGKKSSKDKLMKGPSNESKSKMEVSSKKGYSSRNITSAQVDKKASKDTKMSKSKSKQLEEKLSKKRKTE
jgi:hypothetical protein